jgi:hypothetical protein
VLEDVAIETYLPADDLTARHCRDGGHAVRRH